MSMNPGVSGEAFVLDPYCGSGTTAVACVNTGRHFLACDVDEGYCDIARKRIADARRALQPQLDLEAHHVPTDPVRPA